MVLSEYPTGGHGYPLRMNTGDIVEDFELPTQDGSPWRLSAALQNGPVVLFFYPAAMTKGCTVESCHFRDLAAEFASLGAQRVGISIDKVEKQKQFSDKHGFDYPFSATPTRRSRRSLPSRETSAFYPPSASPSSSTQTVASWPASAAKFG